MAIKFFIEFFNRLGRKSPKFFRILQLIGASLTFAGYIPSMLQRWFGLEVPGPTITMCEDIAKYASGFFAASLLPATSQVVAQTDEGSAVKVTDEKKFPFTANAEKKKIDESVPPPPIASDVPEPDNKP